MTTWPYATTSPATFFAAYQREHAVTRKVLDALPADQSDFKPHERANSARDLAWTFVLEETMLLKVLRGEQVLGSNLMQKAPAWDEVLQKFDAQSREIVAELERIGDTPLTSTVKFFTGPKQTADWPAMDFAWFMLHDQIHHRGQMTIYVRMTGGKVPAVYGPSSDEPWI